MSEEDLHRKVKVHIGGLWCCATQLAILIKMPGMTIEKLRDSQAFKTLNSEVESFRQWMLQAMASAPANVVPPEEVRFLELWGKEKIRAEDLDVSTST